MRGLSLSLLPQLEIMEGAAQAELTLIQKDIQAAERAVQLASILPPIESLSDLRARHTALAEGAMRLAEADANALRAKGGLRTWLPFGSSHPFTVERRALKDLAARRDEASQLVQGQAWRAQVQTSVQAREMAEAHLEKCKAHLLSLRQSQDAVSRVNAGLARIKQALEGKRWVHPNATQALRHIRPNDRAPSPSALKALEDVVCQKATNYTALLGFGEEHYDRALDDYAGARATGGYPSITRPSLDLAVPHLTRFPKGQRPRAERWQLYQYWCTDPNRLKNPFEWLPYWAGHMANQEFVRSPMPAHEDLLTGRFLELLQQGVTAVFGSEQKHFGLPPSEVHLGTLQLASLSAEQAIGADLGIIVDIDIGPYQVRKMALLQIKRVRGMTVDVGSSSQQLTNLCAVSGLGYYVFLHEASMDIAETFLMPQPSVSVASASAIATALGIGERTTDQDYLPISIYNQSTIDWPTFFAFGLCNETSGVGHGFTNVDVMLDLVTVDGSQILPRYLMVVSVGGDGPRMLTKLRAQMPYINRLRERTHLKDDPAQTRTPRGHDHSPGHSR